MAKTKATVRRFPSTISIPQARIDNKNILNTRLRNMPFKLKQIIPEIKRIAMGKKWTGNKRNERSKKSHILFWKTTS